jgi:Tfp pilus assembly protein PilO
MRRVITEHRRFFGVLLVALVANVGVYAAVIYPLAVRVNDADNRAATASRSRMDAQRELDAATGIARSREKTEVELSTFYRDVLPADLDAAHKLTYVDLAVRARQNNLRVARRTESPGQKRGSGFDRLEIGLILEGQYQDIRRFINGLEKAPGFLIIEDMAIDQARAADALVLTLRLATYYRMANDAS